MIRDRVLLTPDRLWYLPDGCEGDGGPPEAVDVLVGQPGRPVVHPHVRTEPDVEAEGRSGYITFLSFENLFSKIFNQSSVS